MAEAIILMDVRLKVEINKIFVCILSQRTRQKIEVRYPVGNYSYEIEAPFYVLPLECQRRFWEKLRCKLQFISSTTTRDTQNC